MTTYQTVPVLCVAKDHMDRDTVVVGGHIALVHNEVVVDNMVEMVVDENLMVVAVVAMVVVDAVVVHAVVVDDIRIANYGLGCIHHFVELDHFLETTNCPNPTLQSRNLRVKCGWPNPSSSPRLHCPYRDPFVPMRPEVVYGSTRGEK